MFVISNLWWYFFSPWALGETTKPWNFAATSTLAASNTYIKFELVTSPAKAGHVVWLRIHRKHSFLHVSKCMPRLFAAQSWQHVFMPSRSWTCPFNMARGRSLSPYAPVCSVILGFHVHVPISVPDLSKQAASSLARGLRPQSLVTVLHPR